MSTHKYIDRICAVITALTVLLTLLFMQGETLGIARAASGDSDDGMFTANDLNGNWDTTSATKIVLSGNRAAVTGNGVYMDGGDVYIAYPGHYILSGELTDGSIVVTASKTDKIWLLLDGVTLHCEDGAALRVEQADKVFLTLAEGTKNKISSGAQYSEDVISSGVDGAVYSRDDLTINGGGTLEVSAAYKHGIVCNDDLVIAGGTITVNAAQDGLHANDSVRIRNAALTISAGDDGITASNDDETAFLYVESGSISIPACYEGMEAIDITIAGGTINIVPEDDGINANGNSSNSVIRVTGGDITVVNPNGRDADGFDSNGSIYIEGGNILISVVGSGGNCALDCGSENGGECVVSGGTVIACGGSTMAEGFDASSPQGFLMYNTSAAAGTEISLENGQQLLSAKIPCSFTTAILSAPGLKQGDICTLTIDGVQEQVTIDNTASSGFAAAGMFRGGMGGGGRGNGMSGDRAFSGQEGRPFDNGSDMQPPDGQMGQFPDDMQPPDGQMGQFPSDMQPPDEQTGQFPNDMQPSDEQTGQFPNNMQPSDENNTGEFFDRHNKGGRDFQNGMPEEMGTAPVPVDTGRVVLVTASVVVLLAGLAIAFKFKR